MNRHSSPAMMTMLALLTAAPASHGAQPVAVVAAENFYADVARQVGGADVQVTSVLNDPNQDPHLFEASPSVARALSSASIVIYNGLGYDTWMDRLLRAAHHDRRQVIVVGDLVGRKAGDNPHVWYDPATMPALAVALVEHLNVVNPGRHADFHGRLLRFQQSLKPIETAVAGLRHRFSGVPVAATEPVFGDMLQAVGFHLRDQAFQRAVMNGTEPSASAIAAFETDLKTRAVMLLIYNRQASGPIVDRMRKLAAASNVPVVAVTETEPPGETYQSWILSELDAVARALRP